MTVTLIETADIITSEWVSPQTYTNEILIVKFETDNSSRETAGYMHQLTNVSGLGYSTIKRWLLLFDYPTVLFTLPTAQPYKLAFFKRRWLGSFPLKIYQTDQSVIDWTQKNKQAIKANYLLDYL